MYTNLTPILVVATGSPSSEIQQHHVRISATLAKENSKVLLKNKAKESTSLFVVCQRGIKRKSG